jgi:hypothetical protein
MGENVNRPLIGGGPFIKILFSLEGASVAVELPSREKLENGLKYVKKMSTDL